VFFTAKPPGSVAGAAVVCVHGAKVQDGPAGAMEEFFRESGTYVETPVHEALSIDGLRQLFASHGMKLVGPPLYWNEYPAGR
jgi:hypothetical protein